MSATFRAILHSYSIVFFSQHRGFAAVLLLVTFAHPWAGAAGLSAAALAVGAARAFGFNREWTDLGAYSFNSLLVGLALSTLYDPGWALAGLVAVGALLALLLSVAMGGWLGARGLPFLSLPFLAVVWLVMPAAAHLPQLGLSERGIYWLNELYDLGGEPLVTAARWLGDWPWPPLLATYLRALSSVLFQDSAWGGLLVALGLLWHSRIAFSLSVLAFLGAYGFAVLTGTLTTEAGAYNLGANYMMAAIAVGGVFVVPTAASYGWALLSVPVTAVLLGGGSALLAKVGLPAFSLPFCLTSLLFLYVLLLRETPSRWLPLTPVQRYSPEQNLYAYTTDQVRLAHQLYFPLSLPFLGEWRCTQGYLDGGPTHQGDWGQALDFAIADADGLTYHGDGTLLNDFYCYNKPVLAPADGVVEEVVDHIEDNAIGEVNTRQNWGNTVVLRHLPGLYTQLSHLRPHSITVRPGDQVRRGEVLGYCGSSGRSPEPHLHFQVQATPYLGSRTLAYPLAYFLLKQPAKTPFRSLKHHSATENTIPQPETPLRIPETGFGLRKTAFRSSGTPLGFPETALGSAETAFGNQKTAFRSPETPLGNQKMPLAQGETPFRSPETPLGNPEPAFALHDTLRHFAVPRLGDTISPAVPHRQLNLALQLPPGYALHVQAVAEPGAGSPPPASTTWEVFTDALNKTYLRCQQSGAVAYFERSDAEFFFTAYYGPETAWLYLFYRAAYRVALPYLPEAITTDIFPLSVVKAPGLKWTQDFVAPFYRFVQPAFALQWGGGSGARTLHLHSRATLHYFGREQVEQESEIVVHDGALARLHLQLPGGSLTLLCSPVA
jgi:murein DD-endopeptidase MepM/ murein hydrolase activator NlpD